MLNLLLALVPTTELAPDDHDEGFLGKLILWARRQVLYRGAIATLRRLDDHDLADLGIARADFPELARRHVDGAAPLVRPYR
jgi:uncharacterized protein YjiS (DUF1127 family)